MREALTLKTRWWMEVRSTEAIAGCLAVMTLFGLLTRTAPVCYTETSGSAWITNGVRFL